MGHYAKIENGIVTQVIAAEQDFINSGYAGEPKDWIQTSYNTRGGIYYKPNSWEPSEDQSKALRGNYAGIGYTYDATLDVFIPPQPYASWALNNTTWTWEAPVACPDDDKRYTWDEAITAWVEVPVGE